VFSYGVQPIGAATAAGATGALAAHFDADARRAGAVVVRALPGGDLHWHKNVLVTGLSQLTAFAPRSAPRTGEPILAGVRILPSFLRAGGYPGGRMTVEVERPTRGLGRAVDRGGRTAGVKGDPIDLVEAQLDQLTIPTTRDVFDLNDAGADGDEHAGNGVYSARLPLGYAVDGMYTFHYRFEYPAGACTTRRELKQSLFVDVKTTPQHSQVAIGDPRSVRGGRVYPVRIRPQDALGNVVGPGRPPRPLCAAPCGCDAQDVVDHHEGSYTVAVRVPDGVELAACAVEAFGARFAFSPRAKFPSRVGTGAGGAPPIGGGGQ
jgi:hypothetical protein